MGAGVATVSVQVSVAVKAVKRPRRVGKSSQTNVGTNPVRPEGRVAVCVAGEEPTAVEQGNFLTGNAVVSAVVRSARGSNRKYASTSHVGLTHYRERRTSNARGSVRPAGTGVYASARSVHTVGEEAAARFTGVII